MASTLDRELTLRPPVAAISGSVLDPEEATEAHLAQERATCGVIVAIVWAGALAALAFRGPSSGISDSFVFAFAGFAAVLFIAVYVYRKRKWLAELGDRVAASLPAGTKVAVEAEGLKIGERTFPWDLVTVEAVGLNLAVDGDGGMTTLLWLTVDADGTKATLDSQLIDDGWRITSEIWRRARRSLPAKGTSPPSP